MDNKLTEKSQQNTKILVSKCCSSSDIIEPDFEMAEQMGSLYRAYACYICRECKNPCDVIEIDAVEIENKADKDSSENLIGDIDFYDEEIELAKKKFSLVKLIKIQNLYNVEVVRGADYQYECHIKEKVWGIGLTFFGALTFGINNFEEAND